MPNAPEFPLAPDLIKPMRALISLSDKTGLIDKAKALSALGIELVSTGGTYKALKSAGLEVLEVSDLTGFPEMMDGRVKTLHPKIHGGILAYRDAKSHADAMIEHDILPIDLVWIDLYPFEQTVKAGGAPDLVIENIDIGGPAMIRSAAKNHAYVCVCVDGAGIDQVILALETHGATDLAMRRALATRAFGRTSAYDHEVARWFEAQTDCDFPVQFGLTGTLHSEMRYGENPHQKAAFYTTSEQRAGVAHVEVLQGKALSYNNINDTDAAFELLAEFAQDVPACVIVKHANPCGVATGKSLLDAYQRALACDAVSAFGGIVALNQPLDRQTAEAICQIFTEVVIAPSVEDGVSEIFAAKKNLRLLTTGALPDPLVGGKVFRSVAGGFLVQERDLARIEAKDLSIVTKRHPTPSEIEDMLFAFRVAKHVKSNAIVYAKDGQTVGIGAGQMNRRDSARIAAMRAREASTALGLMESLAQGSACASEAFFPFADGLLEAISAGSSAVIQPGGSIKDAEVIKAADEAGITMAFTGVRVFRH